MIVVDTSVLLEVLLRTPLGERHADRILGDERHAPHLLDVEFASALRRSARTGAITPAEAEDTLDIFLKLAVERHAHTALLPRVWSLRDCVSAYDASYVALAEMLDLPLLTCDAKLARSHGHHARIELLS